MQILKGALLTFFIFVIATTTSFATWSIIVADAKTGAIGIAGASCTKSVYGIGSIVPGKGAIIVQAMSNGDARARAVEMIRAGATPEQILDALKNPRFDPEDQQYAIVCLDHIEHPATYTGNLTNSNKGALTAPGISVQGNTLVSSEVLQAVLKAALKAQQEGLSLEEILLRALEAGSRIGGDRRCTETTASSAFITIMNRGDRLQQPYLNLKVDKEYENINAVEALRKKFNSLKR